ncbi:MAG: hypothetical protein ABI700_01795 [Chloroflexota bacterium]
MTPDKQTKIEQAVRDIKAQFGERAVQRLSEYQPPPLYPTGIELLDALLGGGLVPGGITVIEGNQTCGRGTLALRLLANSPEISVWIDMSGTFDAESAVQVGVDLSRVVIVEPTMPAGIAELVGALVQIPIPMIIFDESVYAVPSDFPAWVIALIAQSPSVLLALPPMRQTIRRAGARITVELEAWLYRPRTHEVIGYRSRVRVIAQRGIPSGASTVMDILLEDP